MKNRSISSTIQKKHASKFGRIIVLTGARQTGKTTLVKRIFPQYPYISIEDPVTIDQYKSLTAAQWKAEFPHDHQSNLVHYILLNNRVKIYYKLLQYFL